MATLLQDALGFPSLPRAGSEAVFQDAQRSLHERPSSPNSNDTMLKAWSAVVPAAASLTSTSDQLSAQLVEQVAKSAPSVKGLVRRGVPSALRPALWYCLSGGYQAQCKAPAAYFTRLAASTAGLPADVISKVDSDTRTVALSFRQHPLFKTPGFVEALSRTLFALLNHNSSITYARPLCHIVAMLLVVFGCKHQEAVFWTAAAFLEQRLFGYCGGQWLYGVRVEQGVLSKLVARKLPRLAAHLGAMRLDAGSFAAPWLGGLYVNALPPTTLVRVWDCAMSEGSKVLLRTGLALFKMYEQTLSSVSFPDVLRKVLDLRVSRTQCADTLLAVAFKGLGSLPGTTVDVLRVEVRVALAAAEDGAADSDLRGRGSPSSPSSSSNSPRGRGRERGAVGSSGGAAATARSRSVMPASNAAVSSAAAGAAGGRSQSGRPASPNNNNSSSSTSAAGGIVAALLLGASRSPSTSMAGTASPPAMPLSAPLVLTSTAANASVTITTGSAKEGAAAALRTATTTSGGTPVVPPPASSTSSSTTPLMAAAAQWARNLRRSVSANTMAGSSPSATGGAAAARASTTSPVAAC